MIMMFLIERSEYDDDVSMLMMFLIERSEYDDDDVAADRKVKVVKMLLLIEKWKCWRCCRSKGQNDEDVVADRKIKVLKMLLIKSSKCWRCCCWSNSQSAEDVADRKVQVLKMSLLNMLLMMKTEDWRWRLHDVEKLPMIYRCVTLLMLMMSSISLVVVDVEYPSR